jgi:hypothetical protein
MIEPLIAGRPFLYQTKDRTVYHVSQNGVEVNLSSWSPQAHIVAFVESDEGNCEPKDFLRNPFVQIIVASSPKGAHQRWTKQTCKYTMLTRLATSPWSPSELFLTGLVLAFLLSTLD